MTRADWGGVAVVLVVGALFLAFQIAYVEPRDVGLACLHGSGRAVVCTARAALGWPVHFYLVGTAALVCGVWAIARGTLLPSVLAVCLGLVGVIDYNISWGLLGVVLGVWTWLRVDRQPGLRA